MDEQILREKQDTQTQERERLHKEAMEKEKQVDDTDRGVKEEANTYIEKYKVVLKFLWINTTLLFIVLMLVAITLISVWITEMIAQILAFLFISLFGLGFWYRYDRQIRPLIK